VWKVDGDVCIETTNKSEPKVMEVPRTGHYRISDATPSRHRSTDTKSGESSVHRRKEANQSPQTTPVSAPR
jgi:hypothetical protein